MKMQFVQFILGLALIGLSYCFSSDDQVMGWNKASGLWGKRSMIHEAQKRPAQNWNKLNSLWGKRSMPMEYDDYPVYVKRAEPAQWQKANGLWGK